MAGPQTQLLGCWNSFLYHHCTALGKLGLSNHFERVATAYHLTRILGKGGLWVTSFIFKYETSTTYPQYETTQCFILINK